MVGLGFDDGEVVVVGRYWGRMMWSKRAWFDDDGSNLSPFFVLRNAILLCECDVKWFENADAVLERMRQMSQ